MLQGIETVPLSKSMMEKMDEVEMRMLRWEIGLTRNDKVRNEIEGSKLGVNKLSTEVWDSRLRLIRHVKRREERYAGRRILEMGIQGKRRRGRPTRPYIAGGRR